MLGIESLCASWGCKVQLCMELIVFALLRRPSSRTYKTVFKAVRPSVAMF